MKKNLLIIFCLISLVASSQNGTWKIYSDRKKGVLFADSLYLNSGYRVNSLDVVLVQDSVTKKTYHRAYPPTPDFSPYATNTSVHDTSVSIRAYIAGLSLHPRTSVFYVGQSNAPADGDSTYKDSVLFRGKRVSVYRSGMRQIDTTGIFYPSVTVDTSNGNVTFRPPLYDGEPVVFDVWPNYSLDTAIPPPISPYINFNHLPTGMVALNNGVKKSAADNLFNLIGYSSTTITSGNYMEWKVGNSISSYNKAIGLSTSSAPSSLSDFTYMVIMYQDQTATKYIGGVETALTSAVVITQLFRLTYTGSTILIQTSTNGGSSWSTLYTITSVTGTLYPFVYMGTQDGNIENIKKG